MTDLSTRLGSLGRTRQALEAVRAALDLTATQARFDRAFADLEVSRLQLQAELTKPLPGEAQESREPGYLPEGLSATDIEIQPAILTREVADA